MNLGGLPESGLRFLSASGERGGILKRKLLHDEVSENAVVGCGRGDRPGKWASVAVFVEGKKVGRKKKIPGAANRKQVSKKGSHTDLSHSLQRHLKDLEAEKEGEHQFKTGSGARHTGGKESPPVYFRERSSPRQHHAIFKEKKCWFRQKGGGIINVNGKRNPFKVVIKRVSAQFIEEKRKKKGGPLMGKLTKKEGEPLLPTEEEQGPPGTQEGRGRNRMPGERLRRRPTVRKR